MGYSHRIVAEKWIKRKKATGERVFTDGTTIWSHGSHFPMGYILSPERLLINIDGYSPSTAKHKSYVRRAIPEHYEVIECTTEEIKKAVNYPDEPIIITREPTGQSISTHLEGIKNRCREKGVLSFPTQKILNIFDDMIREDEEWEKERYLGDMSYGTTRIEIRKKKSSKEFELRKVTENYVRKINYVEFYDYIWTEETLTEYTCDEKVIKKIQDAMIGIKKVRVAEAL